MRINFNKIICINLDAVNAQQLFAICETYKIGFEELYRRKTETKVSKYWINDSRIVAYVIGGFFFMGDDFKTVSLEDQDMLKKMKPTKTPKMPKTDAAINNYKAFLSEGYDIGTKSLDSKIISIAKSLEKEEAKINLPVVLEVDAILDKIGKYGMSYITKEEKEFLDDSSK
jgi:hypothetical protein